MDSYNLLYIVIESLYMIKFSCKAKRFILQLKIKKIIKLIPYATY